MKNAADLNRTVTAHLSQYPFWTKEAEDAIRRDVGDEGLAFLKSIHLSASARDDWLAKPYEVAWSDVEQHILQEHPDLSEEAVRVIVTLAAYDWK